MQTESDRHRPSTAASRTSLITSATRLRPDRRQICPTILAAITVAVFAGIARADEASGRLRSLLTNLPQADASCSARILDLDTGRVICDVSPTDTLLPASTAKIFVLAAAVDMLGTDFTFRTVLASRGKDLVVIGDGDPSLLDEKTAEARGYERATLFDRWAYALRAQGVESVAGNLIIDDTIFDDQFIHPEWDPADLKKWYAAPVGAINCNGNCVEIAIWPDPHAGAPVLWTAFPPADLIQIENRCKSGGGGTPLIDRPDVATRYVLTGTCSKRWEFPPIPAADPGMLFGSALKAALIDRGIPVSGDLVRQRIRTPDGKLPGDCRIIAEHTTPLKFVLARAGKDSQNMFAETLWKRLGYEWARRRNQPDPRGTWATGRSAVQEFLTRAGAGVGRMTLSDGSGLSRTNRASAADFAAVLRYMHSHPAGALFADCLSQAGADGTLRKRMRGVPGRVQAKTGYLRGVRTLCGYVHTSDGHDRAFSVLFNGFTGGSAPFNKIHDQVCRILAEPPREAGR